MQQSNTRKLVESALMIALATVLSLVKLADLPYGGSVTLASMLPIILISYRNGLGWGLGTGLAYAVLQQLLGLKNLTYVTGAPSVIAVIFLDYLLAFTVIGLAGMFRRVIRDQGASLAAGTGVVCVLRYICHVIAGATVWAGLSIPTAGAIGYSLIYNATYMIPETIVTVLAAYYIGSLIDFREEQLKRITRPVSGNTTTALLGGGAALLIVAGLIYDVVSVFANLQDGETGEFNITLLGDAGVYFWIRIAVVTVIVVAAAVTLLLIRRMVATKNTASEEPKGDDSFDA